MGRPAAQQDVMLALLAYDAYNRGANSQLKYASAAPATPADFDAVSRC